MITTKEYRFDDLLKVLFENILSFSTALPKARATAKTGPVSRITCDKKGVYLSNRYIGYRTVPEKQATDITDATLCGLPVFDGQMGICLNSGDYIIDTSFYIMFYLSPESNARNYGDFIIYDKYNKCKHPSFTSGSVNNKLFVKIASKDVYGMSYTLHSYLSNCFDRASVIAVDSKCMYLFFDAACTVPEKEDNLVLNNTNYLKKIIKTATRTDQKKINLELFLGRLRRQGILNTTVKGVRWSYLDTIDKSPDKRTDPANLSLQNTWLADCVDVVYDNQKGIFTCSVKP